ncbi:MAG TPA: hypothetical protein VMW56_30025 [Candidatus Margulisiibacteriota bacterium]|nr:hypothetical protein [Candidatus Margulisiibacteriota bacterium]
MFVTVGVGVSVAVSDGVAVGVEVALGVSVGASMIPAVAPNGGASTKSAITLVRIVVLARCNHPLVE